MSCPSCPGAGSPRRSVPRPRHTRSFPSPSRCHSSTRHAIHRALANPAYAPATARSRPPEKSPACVATKYSAACVEALVKASRPRTTEMYLMSFISMVGEGFADHPSAACEWCRLAMASWCRSRSHLCLCHCLLASSECGPLTSRIDTAVRNHSAGRHCFSEDSEAVAQQFAKQGHSAEPSLSSFLS